MAVLDVMAAAVTTTIVAATVVMVAASWEDLDGTSQTRGLSRVTCGQDGGGDICRGGGRGGGGRSDGGCGISRGSDGRGDDRRPRHSREGVFAGQRHGTVATQLRCRLVAAWLHSRLVTCWPPQRRTEGTSPVDL